MRLPFKFQAIALLVLIHYHTHAQKNSNAIKIIGAMKNVMWKGQLSGNINLDTIANKTGLYGLGPVEYLAGEILIINGKSYKSTVAADNSINVEETYHIKAPFFGYANITRWTEQVLPDSIRTIKQLERYIEAITRPYPEALMFRLHGTIEKATIHIVNLPEGSTVSSPDEAHKGQVNYEISNEQAWVFLYETQSCIHAP